MRTQTRSLFNILFAAVLLAALASFVFPASALAQDQILYEQSGLVWLGVCSTIHEMADDFVVPAGSGPWSINEVRWTHNFGPAADTVNVFLYQDAGGQPGKLVYSALNLPSGESSYTPVSLVTPAVLRPGHYWISVTYPATVRHPDGLGCAGSTMTTISHHPSLMRAANGAWEPLSNIEGHDLNFHLSGAFRGYPFAGFHAPVDSNALNLVRAGSAVPLRFSLGGDYGLAILQAATSQEVACNGAASVSGLDETAPEEASGLQYLPATRDYTYVWKTDRAWAGTCRALTLMLDDGTAHTTLFQFR